MRRRTLLAGTAGAIAGAGSPVRTRGAEAGEAVSAVTPGGEQTPTGTSEDGLPVVDNAGAPDETLTVDVLVRDEARGPVERVTVKPEDRGGTPDDRFGETGPRGRVRFLESVGPPPCNTQTLTLPEHDVASDLGCNDGGVTLSRTFTVDLGGDSPTRTAAVSGPEAADEPWLDGLLRAATWFVGVALAGPLVLGSLVALVGGRDAEAADDRS